MYDSMYEFQEGQKGIIEDVVRMINEVHEHVEEAVSPEDLLTSLGALSAAAIIARSVLKKVI